VNRDDESTSEDVSEREEMRRAAKAYASKARIAPPPKPEVIVLSDSDSGETSRPSSRPSIVIAPNRPIAMRVSWRTIASASTFNASGLFEVILSGLRTPGHRNNLTLPEGPEVSFSKLQHRSQRHQTV
jgi:hypothetical protein